MASPPSNEGRGYVLRKIIRRAIQHGRLLGRSTPFLFSMVDTVCEIMGSAYPGILSNKSRSEQVIHSEEIRFSRTLDQALKKLDAELLQTATDAYMQHHMALVQNPKTNEAAMKAGDLLSPSSNEKIGDRVRYTINLVRNSGGWIPKLSGYRAFRLYDTYGLPIDFVRDALRDTGIELDEIELESQFEEHRVLARFMEGGHKEAAFANLCPDISLFSNKAGFL